MLCKLWKFVLSVILVQVLLVSTSSAARSWMEGQALTYSEGETSMPYRLYLPAGYDADQEYPLVLYLHGSGGRGNDNESQVNYAIAGLIDRTDADYPAILVVPQLPAGDSWVNRSRNDLTVGILNSLQQGYSVDEDRLYVTGHSNGGFGTTQYIHDFPQMFAAAAPLSGAWVPPNHREPLTGFPTWLFHGAWDGTVDKSWSENYYRSVTSETGSIVFDETLLGYPTAISEPVRYSQVPQRAHLIGDDVYAHEDSGLYDWMFAQSRVKDPLTCDFDGNNIIDVEDIDSLAAHIVAGPPFDSSFDLTGDDTVDEADLTKWRADAATKNGFGEPYLAGDSNLDGIVDSADLNNLALGWRKVDTPLWSAGDFNADGSINALDLNELALNWRQSIPIASTANAPVPEPSALLLTLVGVTLSWGLPRRS